jgi:hypothetical protein
MAKVGQHVVPSSGMWKVRRAGSSRASSTHMTRQEAIDAAERIARNQGTELYIHGTDGRIIERHSYSDNRHSQKG